MQTHLVCAGETAENRAPRLPRLVPGGDGLACQGADRRVLVIEVVDARGGLLKELTASMT